MADRTQFKHIKVNAASDDVVIYAGSHAHTRSVEGAVADAAAASAAGTPADTGTSPTERCATDIPAPDQKRAQPEKPDDYRETTLQDLRTSKMPAMQKAIIAIAVLAVAAFIVWYVSFH